MTKYKRILTILFYLAACIMQINAQHDSAKFHKTILPILLYDPFTGLGYGGMCNLNFLMGDASNTRYSNAQAIAMYTTNDQLMLQVNHQIFSKGERWIWQGRLMFLNWPEYAYGFGGNTPDDEATTKERIHYKAIELEERVLRRFGQSKNFIGLHYRLYASYNMHSETNGISYFKDNGVGNEGYVASGFGAHYIYDSRDNVQNASKGFFLELAANPYLKATGSTQNWLNLRLDGRYYLSNRDITKTWASRLLVEHASKQVPYMLTPMTGRYFLTRGYVQGRYRGNTLLTLESEYRAQIWKWLGGVLFANVHSVSEENGTFKYVNPAAGGGLRFMLNKVQRTNLRIDYARGLNNNSGLYFHITEVF
jgi:hypothetical protein